MIHEWEGPYSIQTDEPALIRELYTLLYNKAYRPFMSNESVVFRPKPRLIEETQSLILTFKKRAQKAL